MSERDKQRYIQEYMAYQDTDNYKQYIRNKHPALKKAREEEEEETAATTAEKAEKVRTTAVCVCPRAHVRVHM